MGQEITHTHNEEDHNELVQDVVTMISHLDNLYINYHNGDVKLNKMIMLPRDMAITVLTKLRMHIKNTKHSDHLAEVGAKVESQSAALMDFLIKVGGGIIGGIGLMILARYLNLAI